MAMVGSSHLEHTWQGFELNITASFCSFYYPTIEGKHLKPLS